MLYKFQQSDDVENKFSLKCFKFILRVYDYKIDTKPLWDTPGVFKTQFVYDAHNPSQPAFSWVSEYGRDVLNISFLGSTTTMKAS